LIQIIFAGFLSKHLDKQTTLFLMKILSPFSGLERPKIVSMGTYKPVSKLIKDGLPHVVGSNKSLGIDFNIKILFVEAFSLFFLTFSFVKISDFCQEIF